MLVGCGACAKDAFACDNNLLQKYFYIKTKEKYNPDEHLIALVDILIKIAQKAF